MNRTTTNSERRDRMIAGLLWHGTWLASVIIFTGMVLKLLRQFGNLSIPALSGDELMRTGVALFIVLPVARVALMLGIFLYERDYIYTLISALVLVIIMAGVIVGL